jgi:hypothetical protein
VAHGVAAVAVEELAIDPLPTRGKQKSNQIRNVLGGAEPACGLLRNSTRADCELRLDDGVLDTDPVTADALVSLIVGEARAQSSEVNMIATGVLRHLAGHRLLDSTAEQVMGIAAMTDPGFWSLLFADLEAGPILRRFLSNPAAWSIRPDLGSEPGDAANVAVRFNLRRLYLDLPSRGGEPMTTDALPGELLKEPREYLITEAD